MFFPVTNRQHPVLSLKDHTSGTWLDFSAVRHYVHCDDSADVVSCLEQVDHWVHRGYFAAGFVSYEAFSAFYSTGSTQRSSSVPLVWFAICESAMPGNGPPEKESWPSLFWRSLCSMDDYRQKIARIKQAIACGETYQVNFTYGLETQVAADFDPWSFFGFLNHRHQGGYGAYLDIGSHVVCSASPELFFSLEGQRITSRPMKGTAERGGNPQDDQQRARELQHSEKNRAENLMIVDMLRNDLGRLAETGSVQVPELYHLEEYPTLWQLTSTVEGRLAQHCGLAEQFRALFPCASITGAPKKKTIEWINRLETRARGVYTGAIGFISPHGRSQFNVAIRTAVYERSCSRLEYGVGGGIVWDSDWRDEWRETRIKARILPGIGDFCLLETLLWRPVGGYRNFAYHLERMERSAREFGIDVDRYVLRQHLIDRAAQHSRRCWRVRCLVNYLGEIRSEFIPFERSSQITALRLGLAAYAVDSQDPWLRHKTDQRQRYETLRAEPCDVDDILMYNERGEVTETTTANIVINRGGRWLTPPENCGLLPGTMRRYLLDHGRIEEQILSVEDLYDADIYLINSLRGWRWARLTEEILPCKKH
nr:aminodeoxychorismate synthase component I [uncultured Desulfuromonas sp.]